jgi:DNA-binding response OmpR family regulator
MRTALRLPQAAVEVMLVAILRNVRQRLKQGIAMHILIVESNDDTRLFLETFLSLEGHFIQAACDGDTGMKLLQCSDPDAIVIDLSPDDSEVMNIIETAQRMHPSSRIVWTSTHRNSLLVAKLGVCWLQKPYAPDELLRMLE